MNDAEQELYYPSGKWQQVDFSQVQTLDDVINILKALKIGFCDDGTEEFDAIRPYLYRISIND